MDLSTFNWLPLLAALMVASTPILLAGIGELVVEKAGVLNLGVEGMMITGAVCGFAMAIATESAGRRSRSGRTCWRRSPSLKFATRTYHGTHLVPDTSCVR